jgi:hypothetical protein
LRPEDEENKDPTKQNPSKRRIQDEDEEDQLSEFILYLVDIEKIRVLDTTVYFIKHVRNKLVN